MKPMFMTREKGAAGRADIISPAEMELRLRPEVEILRLRGRHDVGAGEEPVLEISEVKDETP